MDKKMSIYEEVLVVARMAKDKRFKHRQEIEQMEEREIKRVVNKPVDTFKPVHQAFLEYKNKKGTP